MDPNICVLICDTDENYQKELIAFLEGISSFKIFKTNNGKKALDIINENNIDIVLLDLLLYEIDGLEVLKNLKSNPPSKNDMPRIIILTNIIKKEIVINTLKLGAWYFLNKTTDFKVIKDRINEINSYTLVNNEKIDNVVKGQYLKLSKYGRFLYDLGFDKNSKGFIYLSILLEVANRDREKLRDINRILYPNIGKIFKVKGSSIESGIRKQIFDTYNTSLRYRNFLKELGYNENLTNVKTIKLFIQFFDRIGL